MEIDCNFQTASKAELKGQKHRGSLSELILCWYRQAAVDRVRRPFPKAYCGRGAPGNELLIFFSKALTGHHSWTQLDSQRVYLLAILNDLFGNLNNIKLINFAILSKRVGAVFTVLDDLLILLISPYLFSDLDSESDSHYIKWGWRQMLIEESL